MLQLQVDSHGRSLLYCAGCLLSGDPDPRQAVTTIRGTALCQYHLRVPATTETRDLGFGPYFNGN